ncbi:FecR family protein [Solimonas terrae]|uniref:FecR domain-containing protein n=1 Tax=Solimonas terrae TaxID=1396819 RepID=A0A6M2BQW5_9GAMM|nr:FecR domain-containing protein [Solimonas terrae]NGY04615.1 FecR domain-containing protein [Solimonas terrae]
MRQLSVLLAVSAMTLMSPAFAADSAAPASSHATPAGEVILLTGRGTATNPQTGAIRGLVKGDPVYSGDILNAGSNSYMNLKFSDGAFVLLRPNTRFSIDRYAYTPSSAPPATPPPPVTPALPARPATPPPADRHPVTTASSTEGTLQRAFLRLLKGGFRTVSGLIGKTNADDYLVTTPVATIGIRGTDYYAYICDLACANDPIILESLDLAHLGHDLAVGATLDGVIHGSIAVTNAAGHTEILTAGQFLLTLSDGRQIRLPSEPDFLRAQPFPDPLTLCVS